MTGVQLDLAPNASDHRVVCRVVDRAEQQALKHLILSIDWSKCNR